MRVERWERNNEGIVEEDFARRTRLEDGTVVGIRLGGIWFPTEQEAMNAGWVLTHYLNLVAVL